MKKILLIILSLIFVFVGCSETKTQEKVLSPEEFKTQRQSLQPKQVVEYYFKYKNEKNKEGILLTLTDRYGGPNSDFGFENLKSVKLKSIVEDTNPNQKEGYMKYGLGSINGVKEENVIIYKIQYEIKYKKDSIAAEPSGIDYKWATVIRKDKNSPWLIDEIGEG